MTHITYDPSVDAMYIAFGSGKKSTRTEELRSDFLVDYAGRTLIGIEILDASKKMSLKQLKNHEFFRRRSMPVAPRFYASKA